MNPLFGRFAPIRFGTTHNEDSPILPPQSQSTSTFQKDINSTVKNPTSLPQTSWLQRGLQAVGIKKASSSNLASQPQRSSTEPMLVVNRAQTPQRSFTTPPAMGNSAQTPENATAKRTSTASSDLRYSKAEIQGASVMKVKEIIKKLELSNQKDVDLLIATINKSFFKRPEITQAQQQTINPKSSPRKSELIVTLISNTYVLTNYFNPAAGKVVITQ